MRHLLCIGRYANSKQCLGEHCQALMCIDMHLNICTLISFNAGLCCGMVIIDQDILGSRWFLKSSWENFLFQVSDGEKGFNFSKLSKEYSSSVAQ